MNTDLFKFEGNYIEHSEFNETKGDTLPSPRGPASSSRRPAPSEWGARPPPDGRSTCSSSGWSPPTYRADIF